MKAWCYFNFKHYINKAYADKIPNEEWWEISFPCEYEILDNGIIEAKIDCRYFGYELEPKNYDTEGNPIPLIVVYRISPYKKRDFLIFDNNKCFSLKNAQVYPNASTMVCRATEYFISYNVDKNRMFKFFSKTKVKSIKIFAETLNEFKNTDIFFKGESDIFFKGESDIFFKGESPKTFDELKDKTYLKTFEQYKHREIFVKYNSYQVEVSYIFKESVNINKNNISKISAQIGNSPDSPSKYSVYIQIDLDEAADPDKAYDDVDTDKVYDYLEEIAIYFQLFYPSKIKIDHVYTILEDVDQEVDTIIDDVRHEAKIIEDDNCFEFVTFYLENFYDRVAMFNKSSLSANDPTITGNILDFLKTCYDKIAYRTCDSYLRNIRHFIFDSSIFIEDSFLCCFRFIELFYKDKKLNNGQGQEPECVSNNKIIGEMIKNHYDKEKLNNKQRKKLAFCIVRLRDHYSHYGYYLPRSGIEYGTKREKKQLDESEICKKLNNIESIISKIKDAEKDSEKYVDDIIKACDKIRPILTEIINSQQGKGKQYKVVGFFEMYEKLRVIHRIAMNIIFKSILGYESHGFPMLAEF